MADNKNMMSVNGKESDSDDDELAALREAALRSKRMRPEERKPVETAVQLPAVLHPVAPLVVACPFDRRQLPRQPFGGRGQMRLPRVGSQNFIRPNARSNLIVIQTVPLDEDKPVVPQPQPLKLEFHASSQEKSMIVRPQDRWAPSDDVKLHASSPAKPKASVMDMLWNDPQLMPDGGMPTKFDRYDSSGSESEEDLSSHDGSDSEDDSINISREKIQEAQPTSEQLQSDSAFTETNADLPASDASSLNSLTNSSKLLLDSPTNSPASEQVLENQSSKRSSTKSFISPENSPSNLHSLVPESKSLSPVSSKSTCSQSGKEIIQSATLRADSKSPVNLKSQSDVTSSSSSRSSSSASSRLLDSPARSSVSPASASPAPPRSRSKSPMDTLADPVNCPLSRRSPVRARSPVGLRSPMHVRSKAHSKSPVNLSSPMRLRSKTRSRSRSRSPVSMRSLSSRSKASSRSPVHLGLKSHSRSPQKLSSHVRKRSATRSRSPVNSQSRFYSGLRAISRSPKNISSPVFRSRSRTRSRSPARRLEVPFRSRTRSRSPPKLLSSKLNRSPSDSRSPRFNRSPVYRKSPVHSKSPVFSRSRELLRSPTRGRLPLVSKGSPGQLKQKAVSGFALQPRSSEHIHSPAHTRPLRISRSPEHISSGVHSASQKISRSPVCYRAYAHSRSPRNSGSPRNLRLLRHSRSPEGSRHAETSRSSRRYRSLERSLSPRQARSHSHSRSPRICRSPVDFSELSLSYSHSGAKSRLRVLGSGSPGFSRSSSPGNGSYQLTSKMAKLRNGGFPASGLQLQTEKRGPREEAHLHRHGSMRLEADRITSNSTTHHHSSHYSAGTGNRPEMETRKPEGRLNNMANAHYWMDNEKDGKMKRISPDLKQRSSDYLKDQHDWRESEVGARNEKGAELGQHDSGYVKDKRSLRDTEIGTRTDLKQRHSDYDQVLEMRKRKFHNVGLASAEGKGQTIFLHSRRLKSRSDNSIGRGKTDRNVLRGDGDNYNKYDDRNEYRMRNRNDLKSDRIESRLDQKLDGLHCRVRVEPKKSESKTDVSEKILDVRSRSGSRGFSSQKSNTAFDKTAEKSLGADECDSESQSSETVSSDGDARLSQSRPSLSDDSDSETEASGPREKRFTERNDLPRRNPVSKLACDDKFRRKGFQAGNTRYTRKRLDIVSREDSGMKLNYIPPLMEGLRFGKLRSRSPSPHHLQRSPSRSPAAKRARNDTPPPPPIRSVLSVVKLAKNASSTDLCTETKLPEQSGEKALLQTVKRSSDEEKSNVAEVENSDGLSDVQKDAESTVKKMDDKCDAGITPSSDQRTIQITFNQKMEFDESVKLSTRRSVHQRLGKIESGVRKDKKTMESTAHQVVAEEKKFVDLRDLIGEKSRQIVYKVDSPAAEEMEELEDEEAGAGDELFQRRKKSRPGRRRRKFNDNLGACGTGKLEGRLAGRSNYS